MPRRKTESRFLKRTGRRASSAGGGGRSFGVEELVNLGASAKTLRRFRELIEARVGIDDAFRLAIYESNRRLYDRILAHGDSDHSTFRSRMRACLAAKRCE
jgi:hypothetical protein